MVFKSAIPLLVAGMLVTGISNSLFTKWQDMQCVARCDQDVSKHVEFSQPVWQTSQMFLGECVCLVPVFLNYAYNRLVRRAREMKLRKSGVGLYAPIGTDSPRNSTDTARPGRASSEQQALLPTLRRSMSESRGRMDAAVEEEGEEMTTATAVVFFAPALCDICGTTLMNVGLLFTPVSIYQMTRGALVLWVGVFSVIFLHRKLFMFHWLSLVTVMTGVLIVGLSGTILKESPPGLLASIPHTLGISPDAIAPGHIGNGSTVSIALKGDEEVSETIEALLGVLLILFAQLFTAAQFVLEEKIMSKYSVEPLMAVGYEGFFGLATTLTAQVLLHFLYGKTKDGRGGYFDMTTGWTQMIHSPTVLWSSFAIALSIALFNFFGLSVTRNVSATARSTIDTCRTIGIWMVSLALGWEVFKPLAGGLQILGFILLCYGTLIFNSVIKPPKFLRPKRPKHLRRGTSRSRSRSRPGMPRSATSPAVRPQPARTSSEGGKALPSQSHEV
ncbi:hypothetical protein CBS101457_004353 [Exobasidium rhododendri]|nr:hypothetical protein CBS101457_004353 [Exobasidium rhododendri]